MSTTIFEKNCLEGIFEQIFSVLPAEVDTCGNMKWTALAQRMQAITEAHLESCGVNREELIASGKTWIIAWSSININRLPRKGEKIIIRVWPSDKKMMMHTRKYGFYSVDGECLVNAASIFMLMDFLERKAVEDENFPMIPSVFVENEPKLPKLRVPFPKEFLSEAERQVNGCEIDYNGHMNNACYLNWVQDVLEDAKKIPSNIWIQYNKELLLDEKAVIRFLETESELIGKIYRNEEDVFAFKIMF